jgi:hypothetical protein
MSTLSTTNLKNPSSGSNNIVLNTDGTTTIAAPSNIIKSGTAVASTSGVAVDFTGIPSYVKRVTVMFNGVSTNGTSNYQVQLGSTTIAISGYLTTSTAGAGLVNTTTGSTGHFAASTVAAASLFNGHCVFTNISGNIWVGSSLLLATGTAIYAMGASNVTLSGTLDRIRITTVNGTDTFDAGSINILWEG